AERGAAEVRGHGVPRDARPGPARRGRHPCVALRAGPRRRFPWNLRRADWIGREVTASPLNTIVGMLEEQRRELLVQLAAVDKAIAALQSAPASVAETPSPE